MQISKNDIQEKVTNAFKKSYLLKDTGAFSGNNPLRSAKFLFELSDGILKTFHPNCKLHVINVSDTGKKSSGEWLYDMTISKQANIVDKRWGGKSRSDLNTKILFNLECEFGTSLKEFTEDVGKLITSKSPTSLFIQGLNQITIEGREDFIKNRLEIIKEQMGKYIENHFLIGFCPSPVKKSTASVWDLFSFSDLVNWIQVFGWDNTTQSLQ